MNNLGASFIAMALLVGLSNVATAIREANVSVNFTAPLRLNVVTPDEADHGPR